MFSARTIFIWFHRLFFSSFLNITNGNAKREVLSSVCKIFTLRSERYTRLALPTYQKLQVALLGKSFLIYQSERFHRISTTLKFLSRNNIKAVITFFKMQNFIPLLERSLIWLKLFLNAKRNHQAHVFLA